jgi:hypothetical protein
MCLWYNTSHPTCVTIASKKRLQPSWRRARPISYHPPLERLFRYRSLDDDDEMATTQVVAMGATLAGIERERESQRGACACNVKLVLLLLLLLLLLLSLSLSPVFVPNNAQTSRVYLVFSVEREREREQQQCSTGFVQSRIATREHAATTGTLCMFI